MNMYDNFYDGLDSDEHGNLIENGFKIARGLDKYKAEAIAHAVSNHDYLIIQNKELKELLGLLCEPAYNYSEFARNAPSLGSLSLEIKHNVKRAEKLLTELKENN